MTHLVSPLSLDFLVRLLELEVLLSVPAGASETLSGKDKGFESLCRDSSRTCKEIGSGRARAKAYTK